MDATQGSTGDDATAGGGTDSVGGDALPTGVDSSSSADAADATGGGGCTPVCAGKTCGNDGCGGVCGLCALKQACVQGKCTDKPGCVPECGGKSCGPDGCGASCGQCAAGHSCQGGACVKQGCQPLCDGKGCGDDGCGGVCGVCGNGMQCVQGTCKGEPACKPTCAGKGCGPDGCGGVCGTCKSDEVCQSGVCAKPAPVPCGDVSYQGCCSGKTLLFCDSGALKTLVCQSGKVCGWSASSAFYDCIPTAQCSGDCSEPSGKYPKVCGAKAKPKVVTIHITQAVIAPFKADRCQWDGLFCSAVSEAQAKKLSGAVGGLIGLAVGSSPWGAAAKTVIDFVALPAMKQLAKPDPFGGAQLFAGGKWSAETPLATLKNKDEDTFTPIWPGPPKPPGWSNVTFTPDVRVRLTVYDGDLKSHDPIGVAELSNKDLAAVLKSGKAQWLNTAPQTNNQLLLVQVSVVAAP